jgi:Membrane bound O-acyl transferase family
MLSSHSKFVAHRVLRFRPGSNLSSYTQLYTAFLISGLAHVPPSNAGALRFFASQAVAIHFEDVVIALAARAGLKHPNAFLRRVGYVWVYCWFVYSLAPWVDSQVSSGTYEHACMKLSLIKGIYQGKWYAE